MCFVENDSLYGGRRRVDSSARPIQSDCPCRHRNFLCLDNLNHSVKWNDGAIFSNNGSWMMAPASGRK